jgi:hypothetical protein
VGLERGPLSLLRCKRSFVRLLAPHVGRHFVTDPFSETTLVGRHIVVLYLYPLVSGAAAHLYLVSGHLH